MAKVNAPLLAFNGGEVSRIALARVDVAKLRLASACQVNWVPSVLGPMMLRPGLKYIGGVKSDLACKGVPFVYAKSDTAILELTDSVLRVWISDALLTRPSVSTAVTHGDFSSSVGWTLAAGSANGIATISGGKLNLAAVDRGNLATAKQTLTVSAPDQNVEHALRIVVDLGPVTFRLGSAAGTDDYIGATALDTGTHSLSFTPTGGSAYIQFESALSRSAVLSSCQIEAAGTVELPTPWVAADLALLRYEQSLDVVYVWCSGHRVYKLERRGVRPAARSWSIVLYKSDDGPFKTGPDSAAKLSFGGYSGNTTMASDVPFFKAEHVGCLFRHQGQATAHGVLGRSFGAVDAVGDPLKVTGSGADRSFSYVIQGTWVGTITLERSFEGADTGFIGVESKSANGTYTVTDGLNNQVVWYRVRLSAYTSGAPSVNFSAGATPTAGICRVTAYVSSILVDVEILTDLYSIDASNNWLQGAWSDLDGWPTSGCTHEGRLFQFRGDGFWGSQPDGFSSYPADVVGDNAPIVETFGAGPADVINWGLSLSRLIAGREGSEASIRSSSFDTPLTAIDISTKDCSTQGSARLRALKVDQDGFFVQQSGRRVYRLLFDPGRVDYRAADLTRLNVDIGVPGFVDLAVQRQPDTILHFVRADGQDATLLHDPDDEVECWSRVQTLGVIENVVVLPGTLEDSVYYVVKRLINGSTKRFWEKLALRDDCVGGSLNKQADAFVSYSGVAITTLTLAHLPSTSVVFWADGAPRGSATTDGAGVLTLGGSYTNVVAGLGGTLTTVTSGSLTGTFSVGAGYNGCPAEIWADVGGTGKLVHLGAVTVSSGNVVLPKGRQALTCVAALGYVAPYQSAKLAYGATMGSPLTQKKQIQHLGLSMFDTHAQGLQFGQRFDVLDPLPLIEADQATTANTVWEEYDEPMVEVPGEWDTDARLCLLAQAPYPCRVGGVVVAIATNEPGADAHQPPADPSG